MSIDESHGEAVQAILRGLRDSHPLLASFVLEVPAQILHRTRGEGFWSIAEHAAHLAEVQPMLAERVRRILSEDNPEFTPFIPGEEATEEPKVVPPVEESLERFADGREEIVRLLEHARPEDWDRSAVHPEYEDYDLFILARHILMHDHWHMYRMEELWLTRDQYLTRMEG